MHCVNSGLWEDDVKTVGIVTGCIVIGLVVCAVCLTGLAVMAAAFGLLDEWY